MKMFRSTLAQGGFSMLEVMVAVSIMSLIAVATTPVWINDYNEKRSNLTIEETQSILDAARVYRVEHGTWPGGTTCLSAVNALKSTSPPLLAGVTNVNPFNQTLSTSCTTTTFSVDQTVSPDWDGVVANGLASSQVLSAPSNTVRTTIGVPGTEPALDSKLSRIATGNAEMNRMQTTLLLGNNDIREVAHIDADSLNVAGNTTTGTLGVVGAASAASMAVSGTTTTGALNVTGNAVVGGTTRLNGAVTFNDTARFNDAADFREVVKLNKVVTEGASCTAAGNGAIARNAAGLTLSCQSGVWVAGGTLGNPSSYSTTYYRPKSVTGWGGTVNVGAHQICTITSHHGMNSASTYPGFGCRVYQSAGVWILQAYAQDQGTGYCTATCY